MARLRSLAPALCVPVLVAASGCHHDSMSTVYVEEVARQQIRAARVDIGVDAGDLEIKAGSCDFFSARVEQDGGSPPPKVSEQVDGELARVWIRSPQDRKAFDRHEQDWKVCLSPAVRVAIDIDMGAGEADIDARGLDLAELDLDLGAGSIDVDLRRRWDRDLHVNADVGAGEIDITLPTGMAIEVKADTGVGSIDAPGFSTSGTGGGSWRTGPKGGPTIYLDLDAGAGQIDLTMGEPD